MNNINISNNKNELDCVYFCEHINQDLTYHTEHFDYDFNNGFRIKFNDEKPYQINIIDKNTRAVLYTDIINPDKNTIYTYVKKYFIEYEISIFQIRYDNIPYEYPLEVIKFDIQNKDILFIVSGDEGNAGLGDTIAWMTAIYKFKLKYPSINCYVCDNYIELVELINKKYDFFKNISINDLEDYKFYATYQLGCFFDDTYHNNMPLNYQDLSLVEMGYSVLGLEFDKEFRLDLKLEPSTNKLKKPYVCISTHASGFGKEWLNKFSFNGIINLLTDLGYTIYAIDMDYDKNYGKFLKSEAIQNSIDLSGNYTLIDRAEMLSEADFFIGVSSGLSWLAWTCGIPVVLISGFTNPRTEFQTPYRVINYIKCNSCWNDKCIQWDMNATICPRMNNNICDERFLECSTSITFGMVLDKIKNIPSFKKRVKELGYEL